MYSKGEEKELFVLGAGLCRTGTASLKKALEQLLNIKCYHMYEMFNSEGFAHIDFWNKMINNHDEVSVPNIRMFFEETAKVQAAVDFPAARFYKRILEAYPNAKIILTVRSNAEQWYESYRDSVYAIHVERQRWPGHKWTFGSLMGFKCLVSSYSCNSIPSGFKYSMHDAVARGQESAMDFYNKWLEDVRKTVPKHQLLEFNVKEGWNPLCQFLGVPVPKEGFPHVNDRHFFAIRIAEAKEKRKKILIKMFALALALISIMSALFIGYFVLPY